MTLTVVKAGLWHQLQQQDLPTAQTAANTASITHQLTASLAAIHLTREGAGAGAAGARKDEGNDVSDLAPVAHPFNMWMSSATGSI